MPVFSFSQFAAQLPLCERTVLRLLVGLSKMGIIQRRTGEAGSYLSIWQVPVVISSIKLFDLHCESAGHSQWSHSQSSQLESARQGGIYQRPELSLANIVPVNYLQTSLSDSMSQVG